MAQQTLNPPPSHMPFNTGDSLEYGDLPAAITGKINANFTELYGKTLAGSKYTTSAVVGPATAAQGDLTGALTTACNYSAFGANNLTTRTAAQMFADMSAVVGQSYELEIMNSGAGIMTLVGGTGVTINGTATINNGATRWFSVLFNSATTLTIQNLGSGNI